MICILEHSFPECCSYWIPIETYFISAICNIHKDKKKTRQITIFFCIPVVLEACTVVTFVHGVTDHELSGVSQLSWSFYLTVSMTIFTTLFLFILLHTTLYCKYLLFCVCIFLLSLSTLSFNTTWINENNPYYTIM